MPSLGRIRHCAAGADRADLLRLVGLRDPGGFASFDCRVTKLAGADTPVTIETLA